MELGMKLQEKDGRPSSFKEGGFLTAYYRFLKNRQEYKEFIANSFEKTIS